MKNLSEKILALDFRVPAKKLLIITLIVVLLGGALTAWMMRGQISGLAALDRSETQQEQSAGDGEHDHGDRETDPFESGLVTRPSVPAMIVFIGWIALCGLCAVAYWLTVAAWLYKASAMAGMNRALWTILGLAANVLAVAAFLIVRGRLSRCPGCGAWQEPAAYCRVCGSPMERRCPGCGRPCSGSGAYCPDCGAALTAPDAPKKA